MRQLRIALFAAVLAGSLTGAPALAEGPRNHDPRPDQVAPRIREQERAFEASY